MKTIFKNRLINQLYFLVLFFPLWWILGIEQFFWFLSLVIIFVQFIITNKFEFRIDTISFLFFIFLVINGISFFSIEEKMRYITYFRNLSTYMTAFMLLIISRNVICTWNQIEKLLKAIVFVMLIASVVGILAFCFDIFRIQFKSLTGYILPGFITNTGYGSVIAVRNVGFYNWFLGMDTYFRPSSFFLYSTMFSSALVIVLPIAMFLRKINIGLKSNYYTIVIVIMILALLATTGRVAILSFLISYIIFRFIRIKHLIIKALLVILVVFSSAILLYWLETSGVLYYILDLVIYSRGEGSANTRMSIYIQTFSAFLERPFFGWGTERDIKGLAYPLGSHSYYLGILYKQGVFGFLVFVSMIIVIWKKLKGYSKHNNKLSEFLSYGQLVLLVYFFNSFTDVLDLDATTIMFLWLILSLLIATNRMLNIDIRKQHDA